MIKPDALKRIIDQYEGGQEGLAAHLVKELEAIESIRRRRLLIGDDVRRAEEENKKRLAGIAAKLADIRADCKHWSVTYHGDPSGGSDSWTECDQCGKEIGKDKCKRVP